MDGLEAIKWAWILIRIGEEPDIHHYIQRFEQLIRRHADRIPQVKEAWNTFSWQLAMQMRSGVTFKQASADILQDDTIQLTDILSQPATKKPRSERSPKGKGKGKYKSDRQPFRPIRLPRRYNTQPYQPSMPSQPSNSQWQPPPQWNQPPQQIQWQPNAPPPPQWGPNARPAQPAPPAAPVKGHHSGKKGKSSQQWQ